MDCNKIRKLIYDLRKEKSMTQKELADAMNISDKTISKWERGMGCPDVSLLSELSKILGVNIGKILSGDLDPNDKEVGNMKKLKFYICSECGNIITSTSECEMSCCGRNLLPQIAKKSDEEHHLNVQEIENDFYITFNHDMSKEHFITFIAYVTYDKILFVKLYPQQGSETRIPKLHGGKFYFGCSSHGLWINEDK